MTTLFLVLFSFQPQVSPQAPVILEIHYSAILAVIKAELFKKSNKKRYYLEGNVNEKCKYAFLEDPELSTDGKRLVIDLKFSGRASLQVAGNCIGPGEAFRFKVSGVPKYDVRQGKIILDNLRIDELGHSSFHDLIRSFVEDQLPDRIDFALVKELNAIIAAQNNRNPYKLTLSSFNIPQIQVTKESLIIHPSFTLTAR